MTPNESTDLTRLAHELDDTAHAFGDALAALASKMRDLAAGSVDSPPAPPTGL
jgi:hypothetical protein